MKTKLAILAASTALGALIAVPAIGAIKTLDLDEPYAALSKGAETLQHGLLKLASNDDDDHDDENDDIGGGDGSQENHSGIECIKQRKAADSVVLQQCMD